MIGGDRLQHFHAAQNHRRPELLANSRMRPGTSQAPPKTAPLKAQLRDNSRRRTYDRMFNSKRSCDTVRDI